MIFVKLKGGLGNQLFQFMAAFSVAMRNKSKVVLMIGEYSSLKPDITPRIFELNNLLSAESFALAKLSEEKLIENPHKNLFQKIQYRLKVNSDFYENSGHFESFSSLSGKTYLNGYFQDLRFAGIYLKAVIEQVTFPSIPNLRTIEMEKEIKLYNHPSALHIRRGDYVSDPKTKSIHGISLDSYYEKAIALMEQNPENKWFVFSDDIEWVKKNLKLKNKPVYIDWNNEQEAWQDLKLMSMCKGFVIANSTFSWWGATLSKSKNKTLIAPSIWFSDSQRPGPQIFDEHWILI